MKICKKCILPEHENSITIDETGLCSICRENLPSGRTIDLVETDLCKLINKYKGKSRYDCLVMCSGGKDSIAALYFMKKRYGLNPLVFMFDNGFEDEQAITNVKNAVKELDVDLEYFKSTHMFDMFKEMVYADKPFPACAVCSLWYMGLVYDVAKYHGINLIIGGWTKGQLGLDSSLKKRNDKQVQKEMAILCEGLPSFIKDMRKKYDNYKDFPLDMNELKKRHRISSNTRIVSPHWFLPIDAQEYTQIIEDKLSWKPIDKSYPIGSTNCKVNFLGSWLCLKKHGFTHFHIEQAKLIREGVITKEQAQEILKFEDKDILKEVCDKLGVKENDCS